MSRLNFIKSIKPRQVLVLALLAYLLNFFWETWHASSLYICECINKASLAEYAFPMSYVSFVDMTLIVLVFIGGMFIWKNSEWFKTMNLNKWLYFLITLLAIAVFIEIKAVFIFNQWAYTDMMPTIFGLGLSPLLQLMVTGGIALMITRWVR